MPVLEGRVTKVIELLWRRRTRGHVLQWTGQCTRLKTDFPEPGITVWTCFLELSGLKDPYKGGMLTTSTVDSRNPLGETSDPPGYTQPTIATVRLWRRE
jgi:hypothetical protein